MLNVIKSSKTDALINLPNNYVFGKEYDKLVFKKKVDSVESIDYILENDYIGNTFDIIFTDEFDSSNNCIALSKNDIKLPLKLRNRKNGDTIEVLNLNGKKKVNDIFIDSKVPSNKRNIYPLLVDSNDNILWIPGIKKSKFAKAKNEKYDIILCCKEKR
jgi:tRNA(Ile)-lysidine synthase